VTGLFHFIKRRAELMTFAPKPKIATPKQKYKSPSLTEYGQLKDLTTGGSGNKTENNKGQLNRKP
jgi:hypothetical protein